MQNYERDFTIISDGWKFDKRVTILYNNIWITDINNFFIFYNLKSELKYV